MASEHPLAYQVDDCIDEFNKLGTYLDRVAYGGSQDTRMYPISRERLVRLQVALRKASDLLSVLRPLSEDAAKSVKAVLAEANKED